MKKGLLLLLAFLVFLAACSHPGDNTDNTVYPPPAPVSDSSYTIIDSSDKGGADFTWHIPVSGTPVYLGDEQFSESIPLGFDFYLFDSICTIAHINSNGFLTLQNTVAGSDFYPSQVPDSTGINSIIAGLWADFDPSEGGEIYYDNIGEEDTRIFIVSYVDIPYKDSSSTVTFQIFLYETSNDIKIQYSDFETDGQNHTIGIENAAGDRGSFPTGMNLTNFTVSNLSQYAIQFSPQQ